MVDYTSLDEADRAILAETMSIANRVLIADDHPLYRDALRHIVAQVYPRALIVEAASQEQVLALVHDDDSFDLVLLDLGIPGATGLSCLQELRKLSSLTPIVVISANAGAETMRAAFDCGATGYLPKSAPKIIMTSAFNLVMSGGIYVPPDVIASGLDSKRPTEPTPHTKEPEGALSHRQQLVLQLIAEGKANKEIARVLSISEVTVKAHVSAILKKLGVENRVQAALAARKLGGAIGLR